MKRPRALLLTIAIALSTLPLTGCWVYSVYPLVDEEKPTVNEPRIVGNWHVGAQCRIAIAYSSERSEYEVTASSTSSDDCLSPSGLQTYRAKVVEIEDRRYLQVRNSTVEGLAIPAYSFFRLDVNDDRFALIALDGNIFERAVGNEKLTGWSERFAVILTTSTKTLRSFFAERQNDPDFFVVPDDDNKDGFVWRRLKEGVPVIHPQNDPKKVECQKG